jgi:hypothetical protein
MRPIRFLALTCVLLLPATARAQSAASAQADSTAVHAVVGRYLHGLRFNDVGALKEAFWPGAKLFWVKRDGTQGELSQEDWYKGFTANAGKEEEGDLKATALEVTGDIASVKVVETYKTSVYVDYLSLLKVQGKWRIVNKVYTSHRR